MPETIVEPNLRDVARAAVRDEVLRHAWGLFSEQGFEATTIDQVAEAAGMSRRTFFRYFDGKDELVLARLLESGDRIAAALRDRPDGERAWTALRAAFDEIVRDVEANADRARPLQLMLRDEPGARASMEHRRERWIAQLAPLVGLRLHGRQPPSGPDVRAVAVTASALACLDAAQLAWAENPGSELGALLDAAMDAVGSVAR
jgi:AcrR family transcriptional regulator